MLLFGRHLGILSSRLTTSSTMNDSFSKHCNTCTALVSLLFTCMALLSVLSTLSDLPGAREEAMGEGDGVPGRGRWVGDEDGVPSRLDISFAALNVAPLPRPPDGLMGVDSHRRFVSLNCAMFGCRQQGKETRGLTEPQVHY